VERSATPTLVGASRPMASNIGEET